MHKTSKKTFVLVTIISNLVRKRVIFAELLLQPLFRQQKRQKYSSLLRSQPSRPRPRFIMLSSKLQGPRPHSRLMENPLLAESKDTSKLNTSSNKGVGSFGVGVALLSNCCFCTWGVIKKQCL